MPPRRGSIGTDGHDGGCRFYGIEQLGAGDEHHARARQSEKPAAKSRILGEVMLAAFDRADRDRISHQPRFGACLDGEEASDFSQHGHSLTRERLIRSFEPFAR
jgi:hypothetical protein